MSELSLPPAAAAAGFAVTVLPIVLTPGASFTLAGAQALTGNKPGVRTVVLGTGLGIVTHATLAAAGLSAVVMHSAQAYQTIRVLGGLYLIALGVLTLLRARDATTPTRPPAHRPVSLWSAWSANVLNPKAAAVYLTLAPQFLTTDTAGFTALLLFAGIHTVLMAAWLFTCGHALRLLTRRRRGPRLVRAGSAVGGAVLVALGTRTLSQPS